MPTAAAVRPAALGAERGDRIKSAILAHPLPCPPSRPAECHDSTECRRFHAGPGGCSLFPGNNEVLAPAKHGRSGGGAWQAGAKQA